MRTFTTCLGIVGALALQGVCASAWAELPAAPPSQWITPLDSEVFPTPDELQTPFFGADVSTEGEYAVVGMPGAFDGTGRVAVFARKWTGQWTRVATLRASRSKEFGRRVAIANGRILVASRASLFLFAPRSGAWRQVQKIGLGAQSQIQDLDWNAQLAAAGVHSAEQSSVYVFRPDAQGLLRRIARLAASDALPGDRFGAQLAVSGDTVAITAPGYNADQGAAYLYACAATLCRYRQKLLANDGEPGDLFGAAVDLQGSVLAIGAPGASPAIGDESEPPGPDNPRASGAAYLFTRTGNRWSDWGERLRLRPGPDDAFSYWGFGAALALTRDRLLVGAPYGFDFFDPAITFVYERHSRSLSPTMVLYDEPSSTFSIALSERAAFIGAPDSGFGAGIATVYELSRPRP